MKVVQLIVFVILPFLVQSQSFKSLVFDDLNYRKSEVLDQTVFRDSLILVSSMVNTTSCRSTRLHAVLPSGERIWTKDDYHEVLYTDSNYIYSAGRFNIDGDIDMDYCVISKYDVAGNELYEYKSEELYLHELENAANSIVVTPEGVVLVSYSNRIFKGSENTGSVRGFHFRENIEVSGVAAVDDLAYLVYTQNVIYKTDSSFYIVDSLEYSEPVLEVVVFEDSVYALFENALVRMDTGWNNMDTVSVNSTGFSQMSFSHNRILLQTKRADSLETVELRSGLPERKIALPLLVKNPSVVYLNTHYIVTGNSLSDQSGLYIFDKPQPEFNENSLHDIELIDFNLENINLAVAEFEGQEITHGYRFDGVFHIKNNGNEPVNNLAVYSLLRGGMNCGRNLIYRLFSEK